MYNALGMAKGLNLVKILGGLSKTLQIANQVIPIYQKAKPVIKNARNIFSLLKEVNNSKITSATNKNEEERPKQIEIQKQEKKETSVSPTFFL